MLLVMGTACTEVQKQKSTSEVINYAVDPLDEKIAEIENVDIFAIRGEETVDVTDEGIIRYCPVKFINDKTGAVKDTIFVINEDY